MSKQDSNDPTPTPASPETDSSEYGNALIPLLWLLIPFAAILAYGFLG